MNSTKTTALLSVFFLAFILFSGSVYAILDEWTYKRPINFLVSSGSTEQNYQVPINITYDSDMQADFDDLRFTNLTEEGELKYWIENKSDSNWAYVWVEIDQNITIANQTLAYMYYGNAGVSTTSNGSTTFLYFQDFNSLNDGDLNTQDSWSGATDWDVVTDAGCYEGTKCIRAANQAADHQVERTVTAGMKGRVIAHTRASDRGGGGAPYLYQGATLFAPVLIQGVSSNNMIAAYFSSTKITIITPIENDTWYRTETLWSNTTYYNVTASNDTVAESQAGNFYQNPTLTTGLDKIRLSADSSGAPYTGFHWIDLIYYAKYTSPEPTYSTGAKQSTAGPLYSNITVTPTSPQTHPVSGIEFNITWVNGTNGTSVDAAWMNANFSGSFINYYMTNYTADNYTYNLASPAAGYFAYRFYANDTMGKIASADLYYYTINKESVAPALTATPGWTIERNIDVNVSCSADVNVILTRDGNVVSNPYVAKLPYGIYSFNCTPEDSQNYTGHSSNYLNIISGGFGCTDNGTFAFQKTISSPDNLTTLNFTTLVSNNFAKANLSDVHINQSAYNVTDVWENITNGYYIIVNTTNTTSFVVEFGNYLGDENYSTHALGENITNIINYDEQNAYYVLTFIDEISGETQLPPDSNVSVTILCSSGTSTFAVNDTQVLVPTFDSILNELRATVSYPSDQYVRTYIIDSAVEYKNIYLADAYQHTILQIPIYMLDYNYFDSRISIYKTDVGSIYIITDGYFDMEHKFVTYLVKDEKYYIRIEQDSETRDVGFLIPATATVQYLSINVISLRADISLISNNLQLAAETNESASSLVIQYSDRTNQTSSVRIMVYEDVNQTALFDVIYPNENNLTITINGVNTSKRFSIVAEVTHPVYGNSPVELVVGAGAFGVLIDLGVDAWLYPVFGFMIMLFTSFIIHPKIRFAGLVFLAIIFGTLCFMQWFEFAASVLVLIIIFIAISVVYEVKKGGMT